MTKSEIFISYARDDKPKAVAIAAALADAGLSPWYDAYLGDGRYDREIPTRIAERSVAFIALLTDASAGSRASGWVKRELELALEHVGEDNVTLLQIGDFHMNADIYATTTFLQKLFAPDIDSLLSQNAFRARIERFGYLSRGDPAPDVAEIMRGYPSAGAAAPATPATVEDWYAAGPTPAEQALAMAVAALPDVPVETVFAVAQLFETRLEAQLRALTEAEQATAPRAIGHSSRSERLARVAARQTTLRGAHGAPSRVVRFEDPNWRATLLEHVWTERDDVRDVFLDCIFELIEDDAYRPVGAALALSLGQIAQRHFEAVEQLVLRRWIADLGERNLYWRSRIIGSLLASAVARNENIGAVTRLLDAVVAGGGGPRGRLTYQHLLALRLGLGPLGLARPDIAIAVLKLFGRRTFFWERQMRHVAETSLSLEGPANDAPALETDPEADPDAAAVDSDPETPEAAEASDKGDPAATEATGEADRPAGGLDAAHAVLPAAELLAALGDWADEAAPDEPAKGLRQVPIRAVMLAIARMPVHAGSGSGRLSIADLMTVIDRREPALIDRLAKAFQRAAVATPYARSRGYLPIRHLRLVFQTLAWRRLREREAMRRVCEPLPAGPDPFLAFAARIYAAIAARHGAAAEAVIDGARRRITAEEEAAIRHPGERPGR